MKRILSTVLVVALLLGLGGLAVLARGGGSVLTPAGSVVAAAPQPQTAAAPDAPAVTSRYHSFTMPLDVGISNASGMKTYIESSTGATVSKLLKWDASLGASGAWRTYEPANPFSDDFLLTVGDAFFALVNTATPGVLSFAGNVPAQHSITFSLLGNAGACRYNFISLPLDKSGLAKAADLAGDIGNVSKILVWDATLGTAGSWRTYEPGNPFSENFNVQIGYPYFVCMLLSKPWPVW